MNLSSIKFDEKGLIPAIVQDARTKKVLTLAYMNEESLKKTLEIGETVFYSRSRQELWHKGETSGNTQKVIDIHVDCDQDALVVFVDPKGPACHTGAESCFGAGASDPSEAEKSGKTSYGDIVPGKEDSQGKPQDILNVLQGLIAEREREMPEGAYTTYLFDKGVDKILKKVGEEASEVIIAAKNRDKEELKWEAADLIYHLLVLLQEQKLPFAEVLGVLEERHTSKDRK
ncbi:bifunctional phosphoribosyl-AMP cyclohydrolase/phosphoribosyl-ATP diphosphatase HisIE [Fictibacillus enclensis]|uniref:bifunctional phosphoribosyl-AMP cyclohydrolase/phosphoribosyl-ATP diphosphatase HisIE n=1 Tax=Fictibacillus enclensis TaxID=1017270 RepID=UPI0025A1AC20|nr:bifunctional phosphoribosyl-AMP cyclohydrolase/phosphoribosyl-ATP diphosphatase HisIE [Fictibacillus enclensis]MDM5200616.1 bifunctional phosphoribosyl-AMP cyclohydrolase/phosphoribosyl-ATP diphosphatase HisIE [Fictibacillus enclensis]